MAFVVFLEKSAVYVLELLLGVWHVRLKFVKVLLVHRISALDKHVTA